MSPNRVRKSVTQLEFNDEVRIQCIKGSYQSDLLVIFFCFNTLNLALSKSDVFGSYNPGAVCSLMLRGTGSLNLSSADAKFCLSTGFDVVTIVDGML